jgi:hypothetical protein
MNVIAGRIGERSSRGIAALVDETETRAGSSIFVTGTMYVQ